MTATLDLYSLTLAHGDTVSSSSPALRFVDWKRSQRGIQVQNPRSERVTVSAGAEVTIFDGSRALALDNTTAFDLSLSALLPDTYRLTWTGGTDPSFRTTRALDLNGIQLTVVALQNGSLTMAAGASTPFSALQVGDELFVPGMLTGDGSTPFNGINQGRWVVLGQTGAAVTLARPAGQDFQGLSETVTPTSADQVLAYGPSGVQLGDKLDLSAGFAAPVLKMFEISAVTSRWIEVKSSTPLAAQSGVTPTATGFKVFAGAKRFIRVEVDQEAVLKINGDTSASVRLSPWLAGDPEQVGEIHLTGPVWSLKLLNRSAQNLYANIFSAE